MAPSEINFIDMLIIKRAEFIKKRQNDLVLDDDDDICDPDTGIGCSHSSWSNWDTWGRWVALVAIIVFFLILAFLFSWLANRRRRRLGRNPMYGTGWVPYVGHPGLHPPAYGQQQYDSPHPNDIYASPPPKYAGPVDPQQTGSSFTDNPGYYGHHNNIELQQPSHTYQQQPERGDEYVYGPPAGPPPSKDEKN